MSSPRCVPLLALVAVLAGCGGTTHGSATTTGAHAGRPATPRTPATPPTPRVDPRLLAPRSVPRTASGPASAQATRVIRAWSLAVRRNLIALAARSFALPSQFQNGSPVLQLSSRRAVELLLSGLSCGAIPVRLQAAAHGFTIVRFRLVQRPGGDCAAAVGQTGVAAILVRGGKIRGWYRLPELEGKISANPVGYLV